MRIRIGDRQLDGEEYAIGAVAKGRIFGKGMKFPPQAKLDDGMFDIVLVKGMKFREFCFHGWKVFFGTHLSHPKISLIRGTEVEAAAADEEEVLIELDGEQLGILPARLELIPRRLLVKGYV